MRRALVPALVVILSGVLSCSDIPTMPQAPLGTVIVEGIITDRDGPALAGASIAFRSFDRLLNQPGSQYQYARTDLSGVFQIKLAEGLYQVRIEPDDQSGTPPAIIPRFEVKAPGSRLDYRFTGSRVTGNVTGPGGSSLSRARITAISPDHQIYLTAFADGGHYSMLLPPGEYEFYAESDIYYESGIPRIEVEANITAADTLIDFALTGNVVSATVTIGGVSPLAGVQIFARSDALGVTAVARSNLDGVAVLYLPDGGYTFIAQSLDYSIVGPESGTWSISGDTSVPINFPGTRWDITLRRIADGSVLPFSPIYATEIGSSRHANATSDLLGRFRMFVRPNVGYDLLIAYPFSSGPTIANISSTADSTFDLFVDVPVP